MNAIFQKTAKHRFHNTVKVSGSGVAYVKSESIIKSQKGQQQIKAAQALKKSR